MEQERFYVLALSLSLIGLFILSVVLLILIKSNKRQVILLINILVTSICHSVVFIALWSTALMTQNKLIILLERVFLISCCYFYVNLCMGVFGVTIDRFIASYRPLHHKVLVTRRRVYMFISLVWTLSFLIKIPFLVWPQTSISVMILLDVVIAFLSVVIQPATYVYMYRQWRGILKRRERSVYNHRANPANCRKFLITSLLVGSVCILQTSLDFLYVNFKLSLPMIDKSALSEFGITLWILYVVITPVIYAFLKPSTRSYVLSKWRNTFIENVVVACQPNILPRGSDTAETMF